MLGWGSTFGPITGAVRQLRADGVQVAQAHLRYLNPMPRNTEEVLRRYRQVVLPEMNLGQLALLLRGMFLVDAIGVNQVRGLPFRVDDLIDAVRAVLDGTAPRTRIGTAGAFGTGVPTIEVGAEIAAEDPVPAPYRPRTAARIPTTPTDSTDAAPVREPASLGHARNGAPR